jgi:hypothetical protein
MLPQNHINRRECNAPKNFALTKKYYYVGIEEVVASLEVVCGV